MPELEKDAKVEPEETFDDIADKVFDEHEASSASKAGKEETKDQEPGVDQDKKATLDKETEPESGPEDKLNKIKEILGDDEKAIDAYIKSKGYHTDPAWQKLLAKSKVPAIDEETQKQLEEFKQVTSSREYVETAMKAKGFTEEAINTELQKRGFDVTPKEQDDVGLVLKSLNIDPKGLDDNTRATISDISKITDVILKDRLSKILPSTLKPFEDNLSEITRREGASKITQRMQGIVENEGVLDYKKDIEPALSEWLDKNKEAKQEDVFNAFLEMNHSLSLERLKTGKKRVGTQETKDKLRKSTKTVINMGDAPKKTGDFDQDADALLDSLGVQ